MNKRLLRAFIMLAVLAAMAGCKSGQEKNTFADTAAREETAIQTAAPAKTSDFAQEETAPFSEEKASSKSNEEIDPLQTPEPVRAEERTAEQPTTEELATEEAKAKMLKMMIEDTTVAVAWENNESVEALKALCENEPLVIRMSMYGGFEQVGPIGTRLPSRDAQTTTSAGDIVLYSSNQIVVFYGSNSWAYTRLGHITDRDASGMADLLSNGNVTITISMEDAE